MGRPAEAAPAPPVARHRADSFEAVRFVPPTRPTRAREAREETGAGAALVRHPQPALRGAQPAVPPLDQPRSEHHPKGPRASPQVQPQLGPQPPEHWRGQAAARRPPALAGLPSEREAAPKPPRAVPRRPRPRLVRLPGAPRREGRGGRRCRERLRPQVAQQEEVQEPRQLREPRRRHRSSAPPPRAPQRAPRPWVVLRFPAQRQRGRGRFRSSERETGWARAGRAFPPGTPR